MRWRGAHGVWWGGGERWKRADWLAGLFIQFTGTGVGMCGMGCAKNGVCVKGDY
jgi:hypothetical protein